MEMINQNINSKEEVTITNNTTNNNYKKRNANPNLKKKQYTAKNKSNRNILPNTLQHPYTIYNILKMSKYKDIITKRDIRRVSNAVNTRYKALFGEAELDRVLQVEDNHVYIVYTYPKSMYKEINNILKWYFQRKKIKQAAHNELLQKLKLQRLKRTNLIQYNIEISRIEKEKREAAKNKRLKAISNRKQPTNNYSDTNSNNNFSKEPIKGQHSTLVLRKRNNKPKESV